MKIQKNAAALAEDSDIDLGEDEYVGYIEPTSNPVAEAMSQGKQMQPVSSWKTSDEIEPPEVGSKWKFQDRTITITSWNGKPPQDIYYSYDDGSTGEMPIETWNMYVKNMRIQPVDGKTYVGYHVGWRVWNLNEEGLLTAPVQRAYSGSVWLPGQPCEAHMEPNRGHRGGLYACSTREILAQKQGDFNSYPVVGKVRLWGKFVKATEGWRAQYGYPDTLYVRDRKLVSLLEAYGVPVIWEDGSIYKFPDGWMITETRGGIYELLDENNEERATIETISSIYDGISSIEFSNIDLRQAQSKEEEWSENSDTVQHIAFWIEELKKQGVQVSWNDRYAGGHETGNYDVETQWDNQEVHQIETRKDLLELERNLLTDPYQYTEYVNDDGRVTYEDNENDLDEYGIPRKDAIIYDYPPTAIGLDIEKWFGMMQEMLLDIYEGKTDDQGFNLSEPQDVKSLVETFWTTLAGVSGGEYMSQLAQFSLEREFPALYAKLVRYAQQLDQQYAQGIKPQDQSLFDPDQYVMGVRVANPLARFALAYLENLYDQTAKSTPAAGSPANGPRTWHDWKYEPQYFKNVDVPPVRSTSSLKTADYNGWTNHDTWSVKLYADNDQATYNEWWKLIEEGATEKEIEMWAVINIIGPHNEERIRDAQEWNTLTKDERENVYREGDRWYTDDDLADSNANDHLIDPSQVNWNEVYLSMCEDVGVKPQPHGEDISPVPDTLPPNWSKSSAWDMNDVRDAQAWLNKQVEDLYVGRRLSEQEVNDIVLDEMHAAEMPNEWAWALLMEAWRTVEGWEPTGYDTPEKRDYNPVPEPLAPNWQRSVNDLWMNDPHMSSEDE